MLVLLVELLLPKLVGNPRGFRASANLLVEGADYNTMMGKFPKLKGSGEFKFDSSFTLRTRALEQVTGDRYIAQSQLSGEGLIIKPITKGFLAEKGFDLWFKPPKDNLVIPTGQSKLFGDVIKKFPRGKTSSPNVLLSSKSIEATNPRFEIVDFINPSRNKYYQRPSSQSTLVKVDLPKPLVSSRNTLKEIYGLKSLVYTDDIPSTSFVYKPIKFKKLKSESSNSGGQVSSLKMSDASFDMEINQLPRTSMKNVLENKNFISESFVPSSKVSFKHSFKFVPTFKVSTSNTVKVKSNTVKVKSISLFKNKSDINLRLNNMAKLDQQSDIMQRQAQQQKQQQIQIQKQIQITSPKLKTTQLNRLFKPYNPCSFF